MSVCLRVHLHEPEAAPATKFRGGISIKFGSQVSLRFSLLQDRSSILHNPPVRKQWTANSLQSASCLHSVPTCLLLYILLPAFVVCGCFCWFDLLFWDLAFVSFASWFVSRILWFICFICLSWCMSSIWLLHLHHRVIATSETSTRLRNKNPVPQAAGEPMLRDLHRFMNCCNQCACATASTPLKATWFVASLTLKKAWNLLAP